MSEDAPGRPVPAAHGERWLVVAAFAAAATAVGTTLVTLARVWDPVPFTDMWDGYVRFWLRVQDGDAIAWWEQHNEHRILLGKALFWIDLTFFSGSTLLPVLVSVLLLALTTALVVVMAHRSTLQWRGSVDPVSGFVLVAACSVIACWSYYEITNLEWAFQVPFFMCVAAALATLASLAASSSSARHATAFGVLAVGLSALAPWTIPIGMTVPYLAAVMAVALRMRRAWMLALLAVGAFSTLAYVIGFDPLTLGGSSVAAATNPGDAATFFLVFLGGPITLATGQTWPGLVAGAAMVIVTIAALWRMRGRATAAPQSLALAYYLLFTLATALVVTLGRASRGLEAANPDRYQTLILVGWACLFGLLAPWIQARMATHRPATLVALFGLIVIMLMPQVQVLRDPSAVHSAKDRAALALALGALDEPSIQTIYPWPDRIVDLAPRIAAAGKTVLGGEPYRSLLARLGTVSTQPHAPACSQVPTQWSPLPGGRFVRVTGTARTPDAHARVPVVDIVDQDGTVVGYLQSATADGSGGLAQLYGYVVTSAADGPFHLPSGWTGCTLKLSPPAPASGG